MFKTISCGVIILICLLYSGGIAWSGENLVISGDFEGDNGNWIEWTSTQYWVNGSVFEHDYGSGSDVWVPVPYPYEGVHTYSQRKGVNNIHGGLYQVANVIQGRHYLVSGQWSGGVGGLNPGSNTGEAWFEVAVYNGTADAAQIDAGPGGNDVTIAKKTHSGTDVFHFGWEKFTGTFTAQSSHITLALKAGKYGDWDAIAAYYDDIAITEVSFWPMFVPSTTGAGIH